MLTTTSFTSNEVAVVTTTLIGGHTMVRHLSLMGPDLVPAIEVVQSQGVTVVPDL